MNYERGERLEVPDEWVGEKLLQEAMRVVDNSAYSFIAYKLISDKEMFLVKTLLYDGIRASAIDKLGRGMYRISHIPGKDYDYKTIIQELKTMKDNQEDDYLKILERIDAWKKRKESKTKK
jgi:hypothetical protein